MADVNFYDVIAKDGKTPAERFAEMSKEDESFYTVGADLYIGAQKLTNGADLATVVANVAQNTSDIVTINQTLTKLENDESTNGSIRNLIRSYLNNLNGGAGIASKSGKAITIASSVAEIAGVISATGTPITLADVASTGAAEDTSYSNATSGLSATDVQAAIDEVAAQSAGGVGSKTVYITETSGQSSDPFSKRYGVYQGATGSSASPVAGEKLADIDIPKDMVVESGTVGTVTVADEPYVGAKVGDKYIDLVIANASSDHIYIPANSLVDVYTAQQSATQVQLVIDSNNEISATIVAGSITATELASDAVTTAKILDANVTKAKLAQGVQDSLDLADSAVQSVAEGATAGTIAVDGTDVAVHGLAAVATNGIASNVGYVNGSIATVAGALDDLYAQIGQGGSVAQQIEDAINELDTSSDVVVASTNGSTGDVTISGSIKETDGIIAKGTGTDVVLKKVSTTAKAEDLDIDDTAGYFTATNTEDALAELAERLTWREI